MTAFSVHTAVTLVCLVAHQIGPVRNVPVSDVPHYPGAVLFPCQLDDYQALARYNYEIQRQQEALCPGCLR